MKALFLQEILSCGQQYWIIWKMDPSEIERTYNIRKKQTRFYWVCSWELIESATIPTTPSTRLSSTLLSLRTQYSWRTRIWKNINTISKAAKIRQYTAITDIACALKEYGVPDIAYNRDCRSLFTMKRDIESLSKGSHETLSESPSKFLLSSKRSSKAGP